MTQNCVTRNSNGSVIRYGEEDFSISPIFDGVNETYHADVGALLPGVKLSYTKVVATVLAEMDAGEKTVMDNIVIASASQGARYPFYISSTQREIIGADVDFTVDPYSTIIDGYNLAVTLSFSDSNNGLDGLLKKIVNASGGQIQVDSQINLQNAPSNEVLMDDGTFILLMFRNDIGVPNRLWRMIDSSPTGITLQ